MIVLGLTGSIGMGKSTTAGFFRQAGIPVHDADAAVHALYGGKAVEPVGAAFPGVVVDGRIDRAALGAFVLKDADAMKRLEAIVHPLVRSEEQQFLANALKFGADMVVLDIPLLFETGGDARVDGVVVVSCGEAEQRRRVLARPEMTVEKFEAILARQLPDAQKRQRADFIVDSGLGFDAARQQVEAIIAEIRARSHSGGWKSGSARRGKIHEA